MDMSLASKLIKLGHGTFITHRWETEESPIWMRSAYRSRAAVCERCGKTFSSLDSGGVIVFVGSPNPWGEYWEMYPEINGKPLSCLEV